MHCQTLCQGIRTQWSHKSRCLVPPALYLLLVVVTNCLSLKMIDLDAPESSQVGDTVRLTCSYALELLELEDGHEQIVEAERKLAVTRIGPRIQQREQLYAVKWYKNEREFFRFMGQDWPQKSVLSIEGLTVDLNSSNNQSVVLKQVSLRSSGLYRCEVSTDAPNFVTKSRSRRLLVFSLPVRGPIIKVHRGSIQTKPSVATLLPSHFQLSCSSYESKPAALLDWIINDSLNLSSLEQAPWFLIKNKRFFRQTRQLDSMAKGFSKPSQNQILNQQYELIPDGNTAASVANTSQVITNVLDYLDQYPETTTSWLNLTIDEQLLQMVKVPNGKTASSKLYKKLISMNRKDQASVSNSNNSASPFKGYSNSKSVVHIKCIARVLNAPLSDSIRLKLDNPNFVSLSKEQSSSSTDSQQSERWHQTKSSATRIVDRTGNVHLSGFLVVIIVVAYILSS